MFKYDVVCPICGRKNHDLDLDETKGWMECKYCLSITKAEKQKTETGSAAFPFAVPAFRP